MGRKAQTVATGNWIPWTDRSSGVDIDAALEGGRNRTGKGEHKYAAEVRAEVCPGRGQDVRKRDGRLVEVKYVSSESSYITPGEDGYRDVSQFVHNLRNASEQVGYWIKEMTNSRDPALRAHAALHARIMDGEICNGLITGGTREYPIGFTQVLESVRRYCEVVPERAASWLPDPYEFQIMWNPGLRQAYDLFRHPRRLEPLFRESSLPSRVFAHADQVAVVSDDGYFEIDRDDYDDLLVFASISKAHPRFKLAKA